jgi:hypothetical protein
LKSEYTGREHTQETTPLESEYMKTWKRPFPMFNKLRRKMSEYDNQCILLHTKARQTENKAVSTLHCKPPPVEAIKKNLSRGSDFH